MNKGEKMNEKKYRLDSFKSIKRLYANIINDFNNDKIPESKAKTLSYMLNGFAKVIEVSELEKRLIELECKVNDK